MSSANIRNEANELRLLFEISQTLDGAEDLSDPLENALALMARHTGMMRGTVTLVDPEYAEIIVEASYGLNEQELGRAHYKLGEGITGKVIQTGAALVVPHVSEEPCFLNRTGARDLQKEDISFLCVPILLKGKAVGALSADKLFADSICLEEDLRLLQVLASLISRAVQHRRDIRSRHAAVMEENRRLRSMVHGSLEAGSLVGDSDATRQLMLEIARVSASNATVLIQGESGTGKELVAGLIHSNSPRAGRPLVKVNCAALPENLIESELFGHERGAFTGAIGTKKGRFEMAHGGTLFLDEVGELSLMAQAKLLRALQEKEFERVGGTKTLQVDVRLIAATNRDLKEMVAAGKFRQDLYYRVNVFPLYSTPLRERKDDIIPLASHFVDRYNKESSREAMRISPAASALLLEYAWPGNIRELQNVMERAVILCGSGDLIDSSHLPFLSKEVALQDPLLVRTSLHDALADLEKRLIIEALRAEHGNMLKAAERLGITERIIGLRMKSYGLDYRSFRPRANGK
ncbi:sigma 54-interacting transcriptional regulator [Desulfococcaceae bacterium OttesenSCG-928-F15]|nr:sigma 54-interacting transcriptional regulator [Desulfococcaceae bacterium OttesenSCG-928-F15]